MTLEQVARSVVLHRKWIGDGAPDVARMALVIARERAAIEAGKIPASRDLLREIRAEQAEVGRMRNSL